MKRNPVKLTNKVYDLLVIGGGIYGACVAWDATLRGLSVALVDKADFASATSANSLKIIHGGFRYLQHADFVRMRESMAERGNLTRIAPHLVHPLPVLIPSYGHCTQRKEVLSAALMLNSAIGFGLNRSDDPQKRIPRGRFISRTEVIESLPYVEQRGLTGGLLFYDAQVYSSERLVISFLRSAEAAGADLANYLEATGFLKAGDSVVGVEARDNLTGDCLEVRAKTVVNTAGPWVDSVIRRLDGRAGMPETRFAKAVNIVTRPISQNVAVGIASKDEYRDSDAVINKGSRFLFIAPWRDRSLIGTSYAAYDGAPDDFRVTERDAQALLEDFNRAWPAVELGMEDISFVHGGLLPSPGAHPKSGDVQLTKHPQVYDHRKDGLKGLITVVGVKYTTARRVAEKTVDMVFKAWGQTPPKSLSSVTPLHGGDINRFEDFLGAQVSRRPDGLEENTMRRLVLSYGSAYPEVLRRLDAQANGRMDESDDLAVLKAEALHGVREEMAQRLSDVVFRRTEVGSAGHPGHEKLRVCVETMGAELGWSTVKAQQELREVEEKYLHSGVRV